MKKCNCGCGEYVTPEIRFWQKVKKTRGCWVWTSKKDKDGYGKIAINRIGVRAHRYSYELHRDTKIPFGMVIDHLCRNPACVNPDHLEIVSNKENIRRGIGPGAVNARKTMCLHEHPLTGTNLYVQPKTGKRFCRKCDRRRGQAYAERKSANKKAE